MLYLTPYFRLTQEEHKALLALRNQEAILRYTPTQKEIAFSDHLAWVETLKSNDDALYLALKDEQIIQGAIHANALKSCSPSWGLFFDPTTSPLVTSAVALFFLDTLFNHYRAHSVKSFVHVENNPALKFNERLGFKMRDTQPSSFCTMALSHEEWQMKKSSKLFQPIFKTASQLTIRN